MFRLASFRQLLREPRTREFLAWCLPALLAGLVLRAVLMAQMPFAYFHDDAPDFLASPDRLIYKHEWFLHPKKTWLVPTLYTVPFLLRVPALVAIPLAQHALGLGLVGLVGLLCRLWLRRWRWFILPLTLLAAINPFLLWFEHTLMAETIFIFCTAAVALAGTLYTLAPTRGRFAFLCAALFVEAGARPEGKLLFGFGLFLLALVHGREWLASRGRAREPIVRFAVMLALALAAHAMNTTAQAGLLLYTSVARLTPAELKSAPGFEPFIAPIRSDLQARWEQQPSFPRVRDRRAISDAVERYLAETAEGKRQRHHEVNEFCMKLAVETCRRNFGFLPIHALQKFRMVANDAPSGLLDNAWLFEKQREAFIESQVRVLRLSKGLTGTPLGSVEELQRFIDAHYGEVKWFNAWMGEWLRAVNALRLPDRKYATPGLLKFTYFGVPFYFLFAAAGLLWAMWRRGALRPFHLAWGLTLLGLFFVIMLTGNVRSRFRIVFEPFWFLYLALLLDSIAALFSRRARTGNLAADSAPVVRPTAPHTVPSP